MNDLLEFLGVEKEEKQFPEDLLKQIIEILKEFSICEYKIVSEKIMFCFCGCNYTIERSNNRDDAYEIIYGLRPERPSGRRCWLTSNKLIERLIEDLTYRRYYYMKRESGYGGVNGACGGSGITGCTGTEWNDPDPDPEWNSDVKIHGEKPFELPIIYCPCIPLTVYNDD